MIRVSGLHKSFGAVHAVRGRGEPEQEARLEVAEDALV